MFPAFDFEHTERRPNGSWTVYVVEGALDVDGVPQLHRVTVMESTTYPDEVVYDGDDLPWLMAAKLNAATDTHLRTLARAE